jgi:hypothetical protein
MTLMKYASACDNKTTLWYGPTYIGSSPTLDYFDASIKLDEKSRTFEIVKIMRSKPGEKRNAPK